MNNALNKLPCGLFLVTAKDGSKDNGCIVNTVTQVTATPAQFTVAVYKGGYTHGMIMETGCLAVSVLTQSVTFDVVKRFGFATGRNVDKFAKFGGIKRTSNGLAYLTDHAAAMLAGEVVNAVDCGTHTIFVVLLNESDVISNEPGVTYKYYHEHIKGGLTMNATKFFTCGICNNLAGLLENGGGPLACCGSKMTELTANTVEASREKHLPAVIVSGDTVSVKVGGETHPMAGEHHISFIYLQTEHGGQRKSLKPGDDPEATFLVSNDKPVAVYGYCNLHGLWKSEI